MDSDGQGSQGASEVRIVTRKYLFDLMKNENLPNLDAKLKYLKDHLLSCEGYNEDQIVHLKRSFAHFKSEIKQRWTKVHYKEDKFIKNNQCWLESPQLVYGDNNEKQPLLSPQLVCGDNNEKVLWNNPTPSSPRFCRPIRFRFIKETNDVTEEEIRNVKSAISSLVPTEVDIGETKFLIKHTFIMTMVDGKVCNAATGTKSTSRCYICGATSKDFNKLGYSREVNFAALEFGISVLHARIRIIECILHLAYKLQVKKYRERKSKEENNLEKETKKEIQKRFRTETGLIIDMPKSNFGNTNDGNTSRRFFENPRLAAEITGISYELIYRLKVILEAISSGFKIDPVKHDQYASEIARIYVDVFVAAEARNKHLRCYRQDFARKFSREMCNQDVFNRLLLTSDPLLSSMRPIKKKIAESFLPESLAMFVFAESNKTEN